jgi:purine catabolism regulator
MGHVRSGDDSLTLGDLLEHDHTLQLLTGGERALERRVAGAHSIEIESPSTWLERDWVMLTTGVRLRHNARAQRELIAELEEAGAAALGFGVELIFKRVPTALLREAEARNFPVFVVPLQTAFRDIVTAVNSSLLSSDVRTLRRLASLQLYLMEALEEQDPRRAVLDRLATFLDASVTLYSAAGVVVESVGAAPSASVWRSITQQPAALVSFEDAGWRTIATPVPAGDGEVSWLAVSQRDAQATARVARAAARATAPVLAALARLEHMADGQQRAIRGALLDELLDGGADGELAARVASCGVDFAATPFRVVVFAEAADSDGLPGPNLVSNRIALVPDRPDLADVCAGPAGIGRAVADPADVPHSLRDAELALRRANGDVVRFEDFDLATLAVTEAPPERLRPKIDELLDVLQAHPALFEAVTAYFDHNLDVMRTADAMHLHHNSLRYRLARAEEFLGQSLKDPATIASLYIALASAEHAPQHV